MKTLSVSKKVSKYSEVLRLMKTAFPSNEQMPIWLLKLLAWQRGVNFNAYYEECCLCGISYTVENKTIVMAMENLELSPKQAKALLKSPCPLADVFEEFRDRETEHMDTIRDSIETRANQVMKREQDRNGR